MNHDIQIFVETDFLEDQSSPAEERFVFAYTITIENTGLLPTQLMTRYWAITDSNGKTDEVEGEGVIGEQPVIRPGEAFRYTSGAVLNTDVGVMSGSYHMIDDEGHAFDAIIPEFVLSVPRTLH